MAGQKCSPPKSVSVRDYWRRKRGPSKRKMAAKRASTLPWAVTYKGKTVVSRHRTMGAAVREMRRRDLASFRAGRGRPYDAVKVK